MKETILVLKDQSLLDHDNVNEAADELLNVDLVEKDKLDFKLQTLERLKNVGQEHQMEKFKESGDRTLLAKYDEKKTDKVPF